MTYWGSFNEIPRRIHQAETFAPNNQMLVPPSALTEILNRSPKFPGSYRWADLYGFRWTEFASVVHGTSCPFWMLVRLVLRAVFPPFLGEGCCSSCCGFIPYILSWAWFLLDAASSPSFGCRFIRILQLKLSPPFPLDGDHVHPSVERAALRLSFRKCCFALSLWVVQSPLSIFPQTSFVLHQSVAAFLDFLSMHTWVNQNTKKQGKQMSRPDRNLMWCPIVRQHRSEVEIHPWITSAFIIRLNSKKPITHDETRPCGIVEKPIGRTTIWNQTNMFKIFLKTKKSLRWHQHASAQDIGVHVSQELSLWQRLVKQGWIPQAQTRPHTVRRRRCLGLTRATVRWAQMPQLANPS